MKIINRSLSALAIFLAVGMPAQPVLADHGIVQHAGATCFPRLFSQIDQFRMSNGGITNISTSRKTINCSLVLRHDDGEANPTSVDGYVSFRELPGDMDCILYTRSNRGSLIDSSPTTFDINSSGVGAYVGTTVFTSGQHANINHYIQCKVPAQGRVFSTRSYYNTNN